LSVLMQSVQTFTLLPSRRAH